MRTYPTSTIKLLSDEMKQRGSTAIIFIAVKRALKIYEAMDTVMKKAEKLVHHRNVNDKTSVATWSRDCISGTHDDTH